MSTRMMPPSKPGPVPGLVTVEDYHRMEDLGYFARGPRTELIRGIIVEKSVPNPPHVFATEVLTRFFAQLFSTGCVVRMQHPITLADSEPEPDIAVVRGTLDTFADRHPRPDEVELLVEVSFSSYATDSENKFGLYGESGIPTYWIVNLIAKQVEVYTLSVDEESRGYGDPHVFPAGSKVPVIRDGSTVAEIAVDAIIK